MKILNLRNDHFKMLKAFLYIFLFLGLGELIVYFIDFPVPGNILGMILIFVALKLKLIKLETVKPASDKLIQYLMLFFVPFGVGLLAYFDFIKAHWIVLTVAAGLSTLITLYVTAIVQQKLEKHD
ncbi:MAG: CidA/LrgA family protein [Gelidibacter sp.]|uniref:CidA/LrgA family protein n=1 Tax=Gelidibacter sp. TaxID=2018083 RepID=UPI003265552D